MYELTFNALKQAISTALPLVSAKFMGSTVPELAWRDLVQKWEANQSVGLEAPFVTVTFSSWVKSEDFGPTNRVWVASMIVGYITLKSDPTSGDKKPEADLRSELYEASQSLIAAVLNNPDNGTKYYCTDSEVDASEMNAANDHMHRAKIPAQGVFVRFRVYAGEPATA